VRVFVIAFLLLILASLGSALFHMLRDRGGSERMARALTWRVALSITLFALLMLGYHFGLITPQGLR
jgi:hypothetical protein